MRLFWLASQDIRKALHDHKFAHADLMLRLMASAGIELVNGPQSGQRLGRQALRTVSELSLSYIAERSLIAEELIASIPERGQEEL